MKEHKPPSKFNKFIENNRHSISQVIFISGCFGMVFAVEFGWIVFSIYILLIMPLVLIVGSKIEKDIKQTPFKFFKTYVKLVVFQILKVLLVVSATLLPIAVGVFGSIMLLITLGDLAAHLIMQPEKDFLPFFCAEFELGSGTTCHTVLGGAHLLQITTTYLMIFHGEQIFNCSVDFLKQFDEDDQDVNQRKSLSETDVFASRTGGIPSIVSNLENDSSALTEFKRGQQELSDALARAQKGDVDAQYLLACMLLLDGPIIDQAEGAKWCEQAAKRGHDAAQFRLGEVYDYGMGVTKNRSKAVKWYEKAANQGVAEAQHRLGICFDCGDEKPQDFAKALHWYRKAADQGLAAAQYSVGTMYLNGKGVEEDDDEAAIWLLMAVEQGDVFAQSMIGFCYRFGRGVKRDTGEALRWYRKAAAQDDILACVTVGDLYQQGYDIDQDDAEAFEWYLKAAEKGHSIAQYHTGVMYRSGKGTVQNYELAARWLSEASEQGHDEAHVALEEMIKERLIPNNKGIVKK